MSATRTLPVIGLTGGIGSGKSTVARMLADEGCLVCDSDALGHAALDDPDIRSKILSHWGGTVFTTAAPGAPSVVDRAALAARVFANAADRACLESLTHPWIEARRRELFAHPPTGTAALVIDAPLLLEAGLGAQCDAILFVDAPTAARAARVSAARGWDAAELSRRESAQMPLDRKRLSAHHVLRNDGSSDALRAQVRQVLSQVLGARNGHQT